LQSDRSGDGCIARASIGGTARLARRKKYLAEPAIGIAADRGDVAQTCRLDLEALARSAIWQPLASSRLPRVEIVETVAGRPKGRGAVWRDRDGRTAKEFRKVGEIIEGVLSALVATRQMSRQIDRLEFGWCFSAFGVDLSICPICLRRHGCMSSTASVIGNSAFLDRCDRWTDAGVLLVVFNVLCGLRICRAICRDRCVRDRCERLATLFAPSSSLDPSTWLTWRRDIVLVSVKSFPDPLDFTVFRHPTEQHLERVTLHAGCLDQCLNLHRLACFFQRANDLRTLI
jgi:hypothetical protein